MVINTSCMYDSLQEFVDKYRNLPERQEDLHPSALDLRGRVFNKLTVMYPTNERGTSCVKWLCWCECGNYTVTTSNNIKDGYTKSCGCLAKQKQRERSKSITKWKLKELRIWRKWKISEIADYYDLSPDYIKTKIRKLGVEREWEYNEEWDVTPPIDGPLHGNARDYYGERFGDLEMLYPTDKQDRTERKVWVGRCHKCDSVVEIGGGSLENGETTVEDCGCSGYKKTDKEKLRYYLQKPGWSVKDAAEEMGMSSTTQAREKAESYGIEPYDDEYYDTVSEVHGVSPPATEFLDSNALHAQGKTFGRIEAYYHTDKHGGPQDTPIWVCKCHECGNVFEIPSSYLPRRYSCGCVTGDEKKLDDLTGQEFGRLTVLRRFGQKGSRWVCQCECGEKTTSTGNSLRRGTARSCGCGRRGDGFDYVHPRNDKRNRELRKVVKERDGYECVKCGSEGNLNVHHIEPWKTNEDLRFDPDNCATLCESCHLSGFHSEYGFTDFDREDFEEFLEN